MEQVLNLKKVKEDEVEEVLNFYNSLIKKMNETINYPDWTIGLYPNQEYLLEKTRNSELFKLVDNNESLIGATVLNSSTIDDYKNIDWTLKSEPEKILSIHTFAIREDLRGKDLGRKFLKLVEEFAKENGYETIHFDTIVTNTPAIKLYEKANFNNLGIHKLNYEETEVTDFVIFEKDLK